MRLEKASYKAIKYACMNFHYAKKVPIMITGYSVFNDLSEWCGVVVFSLGCQNAAKQYNLKNGEVSELIRVALNGHHGITSKVISLSIKQFKRDNPLVKLLISFADEEQNHKGIIYQATNWYFLGTYKTGYKFIYNGKQIHSRCLSKNGSVEHFGKYSKSIKFSDCEKLGQKPKHKYIYPLDKSLITLCKSLSKPYPKNAVKAQEKCAEHSSSEGAFVTT
jgi:hypothetical protein